MLIQIPSLSSRDEFVHYLLRLGCTVTWLDDETLEVRVTHPETVEDELTALEEWCRAWVESPRAHASALQLLPVS